MNTDINQERNPVFMLRPMHANFIQVPTREELKNNPNSAKNLKILVSIIKGYGLEKAVIITDEHLAQETSISPEKLRDYLNSENPPPMRLIAELESAYADLLEAMRQNHNLYFLQQTVLWIRNVGLGQRMHIRIKDMARVAHMPAAQLKAYVRGQQPVPNGLSAWLEQSYEPMLEDLASVEIHHDLDTILFGD